MILIVNMRIILFQLKLNLIRCQLIFKIKYLKNYSQKLSLFVNQKSQIQVKLNQLFD